jgi:hypothetical protein
MDMSFGFPASYEKVMADIPPGTDIARSLGSALSRIGWHPTAITNGFKASTTLSMGSLGEKIVVDILPNKTLRIRSKSAFFLQCIDFGRNQRNVEKLIQELPRHFVSTGSLGSLR